MAHRKKPAESFTSKWVSGKVGRPSPLNLRKAQKRIRDVAAGGRRKRAAKKARRGWLDVSGGW